MKRINSPAEKPSRKRQNRGKGIPESGECKLPDEEPKLIKNWKELSEVPDSNKYTLKITPDDGNGWICDKETGDYLEYLSTHTFYGLDYEYSTKVLQNYGFNVVIDNWDKGSTN